MGFLEADTSPHAYDPTSGPMSGYFNALPLIIDAGIPTATLSRDALAWRRWTEFCAGMRTQPWRLDRNAHSGADPVGFDRESRLLCAFLIYCYDSEPCSLMCSAVISFIAVVSCLVETMKMPARRWQLRTPSIILKAEAGLAALGILDRGWMSS